ncbi:MAG: succinate dehydrogenase, cytochrome b556 subunit [Alphaproteobacteria bacterium]
MTPTNRPLSPHIQIYRWQLTSVLSILHRMTGVSLAIGTLLLAWWLIAAATGPTAYASFAWFISSWIGMLVLFGFTFALFYHLSNGIRHLAWDSGRGFDLPTVYRSGRLVVAVALGLTVLAWIIGLSMRGGA